MNIRKYSCRLNFNCNSKCRGTRLFKTWENKWLRTERRLPVKRFKTELDGIGKLCGLGVRLSPLYRGRFYCRHKSLTFRGATKSVSRSQSLIISGTISGRGRPLPPKTSHVSLGLSTAFPLGFSNFEPDL